MVDGLLKECLNCHVQGQRVPLRKVAAIKCIGKDPSAFKLIACLISPVVGYVRS